MRERRVLSVQKEGGTVMAEEPDVIRVTSLSERFSPLEFHSFGIGDFTYTTRVKPDETPEQAFDRAWKFLNEMKKTKFLEARDGFYERLKLSGPGRDSDV
jgi:hypothetical protein